MPGRVAEDELRIVARCRPHHDLTFEVGEGIQLRDEDGKPLGSAFRCECPPQDGRSLLLVIHDHLGVQVHRGPFDTRVSDWWVETSWTWPDSGLEGQAHRIAVYSRRTFLHRSLWSGEIARTSSGRRRLGVRPAPARLTPSDVEGPAPEVNPDPTRPAPARRSARSLGGSNSAEAQVAQTGPGRAPPRLPMTSGPDQEMEARRRADLTGVHRHLAELIARVSRLEERTEAGRRSLTHNMSHLADRLEEHTARLPQPLSEHADDSSGAGHPEQEATDPGDAPGGSSAQVGELEGRIAALEAELAQARSDASLLRSELVDVRSSSARTISGSSELHAIAGGLERMLRLLRDQLLHGDVPIASRACRDLEEQMEQARSAVVPAEEDRLDTLGRSLAAARAFAAALEAAASGDAAQSVDCLTDWLESIRPSEHGRVSVAGEDLLASGFMDLVRGRWERDGELAEHFASALATLGYAVLVPGPEDAFNHREMIAVQREVGPPSQGRNTVLRTVSPGLRRSDGQVLTKAGVVIART